MRPEDHKDESLDQRAVPDADGDDLRVQDAPVSSYPEIEEEIAHVGADIDESRLRLDEKTPRKKPIISVNGCDVKELPSQDRDKAA